MTYGHAYVIFLGGFAFPFVAHHSVVFHLQLQLILSNAS